jgi:hypothetical protein
LAVAVPIGPAPRCLVVRSSCFGLVSCGPAGLTDTAAACPHRRRDDDLRVPSPPLLTRRTPSRETCRWVAASSAHSRSARLSLILLQRSGESRYEGCRRGPQFVPAVAVRSRPPKQPLPAARTMTASASVGVGPLLLLPLLLLLALLYLGRCLSSSPDGTAETARPPRPRLLLVRHRSVSTDRSFVHAPPPPLVPLRRVQIGSNITSTFRLSEAVVASDDR